MAPSRRLLLRAAPLLPLAALVTLPGCGFQLRGAPTFAFQRIYVSGGSSSFTNELRRYLKAQGTVQVVEDSAQQNTADVILDVLQDQREKTVVGLTASGQSRELQLRVRVNYRLRTPQGREVTPSTEILMQRDMSFTESAVLAKEAEEAMVYRDLQSDIVQQLLRRLAAVK
jgi:LPS-assembly lipoprotein